VAGANLSRGSEVVAPGAAPSRAGWVLYCRSGAGLDGSCGDVLAVVHALRRDFLDEAPGQSSGQRRGVCVVQEREMLAWNLMHLDLARESTPAHLRVGSAGFHPLRLLHCAEKNELPRVWGGRVSPDQPHLAARARSGFDE
jgi:hypothetical protein